MMGPQPGQETAAAKQYRHQHIPAAINEHGREHHLDAGGLGHVCLQELAEQGQEKQCHLRVQKGHQETVPGGPVQDIELAVGIGSRQRLFARLPAFPGHP